MARILFSVVGYYDTYSFRRVWHRHYRPRHSRNEIVVEGLAALCGLLSGTIIIALVWRIVSGDM